MDKKSLSHTAWKCQYHIVFIPKYRKKKLYGTVRTDVRDIIKIIMPVQERRDNRRRGMHRPRISVCKYTPKDKCLKLYGVSQSSFMGYLKDNSALIIFDRHPELQNKWNKAI